MRPKPQCLGVPDHWWDSRVIKPRQPSKKVGPDVSGEIIVPGRATVFRVTWKRPEATEEALSSWTGQTLLRTESGLLDDERGLFLSGRPGQAHDQSPLASRSGPARVIITAVWPSRVQEVCVIFRHRNTPAWPKTTKAVIVLACWAAATERK